MSELLDIARRAVELAKAGGCNEAMASTYKSREVEIAWRDGRVEKVSEATTRGLSLALYVDGRYSAVSTSDLRPDALKAFVGESIAMARILSPDPNRMLPDPKLYEGRANVDLQSNDPGYDAVTPDQRRALAKELEDAARSVKGKGEILSVESSVGDAFSDGARVTSNGFEGARQVTSFSIYAGATVKDPDGRRPDGYDYASTRYFSDLPKTDVIGKTATERAMSAIGSKKIDSGSYPMVVENRVAGRLVRALLGPLGGRSLQQKQSFLEGQIGKEVASKLLTITDDPFIPKGLASRLWDGEGIASKKFPVIEKGVLKTYYIDDYYGRKLKMPPTTAGSSNLTFGLGKKDLEAILKDVGRAILVTGFLGGNSNGLTGDYSFGVQGFLIEKGARVQPIGEMNISGNQKELWQKLTVIGNDPAPYTSTATPTMVFDATSFAGA